MNQLVKVSLLNVQGISPTNQNQKTKLKALNEIINESKTYIPFMVFTETHLSDKIFDAEVLINNYYINRADRVKRKNGGTAIYMHEDIAVNEKQIYTDSKCESVMLKNNDINFILISVYKPPQAINLDTAFRKCLESINEFIVKHDTNSTILVMGDFNLPIIDWSSGEIHNARSAEDRRCAELLLNFMENHLLIQQVKETTRHDKNTLDLILTNNDDWIHDITVEKTKYSDHDFVNVSLANVFKKTTDVVYQYQPKHPLDELNFNKANWGKIRDDLKEISWHDLMGHEASVDVMVQNLESEIIKITSKHTPKRVLSHSGPQKLKIPRHRRAMIRRKKRLNSKINWLTYVKKCKSRNKINKLIEEKSELEFSIQQSLSREIRQKELDIVAKIKTNPKILYAHAKKNSKTWGKIGPLLDIAGKLHSEPVTMANLLQDQYLKVFSNPSLRTDININPNDGSKPQLSDLDFSEDDIIKAIKLIPVNSAAGPDKFPAIILKECNELLAKPLYLIWRQSLNTGQIPNIFLQQTIVPVFKKGSKSNPENYRPVSLTSHIIKVFGRVLRTYMVEYIESNNLLSPNQHGFRIGKSCLTQLLNHFELILEILENDSNADVLYLDFAKAFDKVDHEILLNKLKSMGISGKIHDWLKSFLSNRTQYVMVNGKKSRGEPVQSGVPQGTVLGPILFIMYINDITEVIKHCYIKIFADDSKLVKAIKSLTDRDLMQMDLQAVIQWAADNKMELNKLKFQLLQHGNKNDLKHPYKIDRQVLVKKSSDVKDLGVTISENISFDTHIMKITNNAKKHASWILRLIKCREPEVVLLLYKTYVRPRLEYASPLWSPKLVKHIAKIESVQRTVTSRIQGLEKFNYWERLQKLNIPSLQRRRERYQMIHMWKISKGLIPNDIDLKFYETSRFGLMCKRPRYNQRSRYVSTVKFNSFISNGPALFNILPTSLKSSNSLQIFKSKLEIFLKSYPDNPPLPNYVSQNHNSLLEWVSGSKDTLTQRSYAEDVADMEENLGSLSTTQS